MTDLYRTQWRPLPDITAWELAVDKQYVNSSGIVASRDFEALGTALRHRVTEIRVDGRYWKERMDVIAITARGGYAE